MLSILKYHMKNKHVDLHPYRDNVFPFFLKMINIKDRIQRCSSKLSPLRCFRYDLVEPSLLSLMLPFNGILEVSLQLQFEEENKNVISFKKKNKNKFMIFVVGLIHKSKCARRLMDFPPYLWFPSIYKSAKMS